MPLRVAVLLLFCARLAGAQTLPSQARFVMSHFKADTGGGDERLYISWSADGLGWTALNGGNPVWQPVGWRPFEEVVRDPAILYANGYYWVAYTQGTYGNGSKFGLVRSSDLLNWTQIGPIAVSVPDATAPLTWSPSFFVDGDGSVHVFVSINPDSGGNFNVRPNMRIYETHPLDSGWTQWSAPLLVPLPGGVVNEFFGWKEGATYHCVFIDFDRSGAMVHATSANLLSGWVLDGVLGYNSQEGPFILPKAAGGYRLYCEPGNNSGGPPTTYRVCDFDATFGTATAQTYVTSSIPMRNGKPCAAHGTLSFATWQAQQLGGLPASQTDALADADGDGLENLLEHALGTDPQAFTPALARPFSFGRVLSDGLHAGIQFDCFPSSADVTPRAEMRLRDGSWSSSAADLTIESQTLLSSGLVRTTTYGTQPTGSDPLLLRVSATQDVLAAAPQTSLSSLTVTPKRAKRRAGRRSFLP